MCGLIAVITKGKHGFNKDEQTMSYQLLYAGALRGWDATGVITCHNNGDFGIMKEAVEASVFSSKYINSSLDNDLYQNGSAMIGHNRAKTIGLNEDQNAHPFVVDSTFALVHNGTLRNHKQLANTVVDSEALAITFKKAMDEEDFVKGMEEAVWKVEGAFACIWYDQKRRQVGMVRNSQRPLFIVETVQSILVGSEVAMLHWIASRNRAVLISTTEIKENVLYLFDVEKGGAVMSEFPLASKPVVMKTTTVHTVTKTLLHKYTSYTGATLCSKNAYKRIRNLVLGKHITFELEDCVEKNLFSGEAINDEYILLGGSVDGAYDLVETRHTIKGVINLSSLEMTADEMDFQTQWTGRVHACEYDAALSQIVLTLSDIIPMDDTLLLTYENKPQTH